LFSAKRFPHPLPNQSRFFGHPFERGTTNLFARLLFDLRQHRRWIVGRLLEQIQDLSLFRCRQLRRRARTWLVGKVIKTIGIPAIKPLTDRQASGLEYFGKLNNTGALMASQNRVSAMANSRRITMIFELFQFLDLALAQLCDKTAGRTRHESFLALTVLKTLTCSL
jgi:hypothetical protein